MRTFLMIRPRDDADARQASEWCSDLQVELEAMGHKLADAVDDRTPANRQEVETALQSPVNLVCYFGHGTKDALLTYDVETLGPQNVVAATQQAIVSVACLTGRELGPEAVKVWPNCLHGSSGETGSRIKSWIDPILLFLLRPPRGRKRRRGHITTVWSSKRTACA